MISTAWVAMITCAPNCSLKAWVQVGLGLVQQVDERSIAGLVPVALERCEKCDEVDEAGAGGRQLERAIVVAEADVQRQAALDLRDRSASHQLGAQCLIEEPIEPVDFIAAEPCDEVANDMALITGPEQAIDHGLRAIFLLPHHAVEGRNEHRAGHGGL
jgi:hypothetical protein